MTGYGALCAAGADFYGQGSRRAARLLGLAGLVLVLAGPALRLGGTLNRDVGLNLVDVGQGQAVILEWPGGRGVVDGGGFSSSRFDSGRDILAPLLTANRAPQLDFVAASHMDRDHVGGLFFLLEHFSVSVYLSGRTASPEHEPEAVKGDHLRLEAVLAAQGIARRDLAIGDSVPLGSGASLEVRWPPPGRVLQGNDSLVLRLPRNGPCWNGMRAGTSAPEFCLFRIMVPGGILNHFFMNACGRRRP